MLIKTFASAVNGIDAVTITIEVEVYMGVRFMIVGLPDVAVKESQQRIEAAMRILGYHWPGKAVTWRRPILKRKDRHMIFPLP
jgi:magnesium chelatase family protein